MRHFGILCLQKELSQLRGIYCIRFIAKCACHKLKNFVTLLSDLYIFWLVLESMGILAVHVAAVVLFYVLQKYKVKRSSLLLMNEVGRSSGTHGSGEKSVQGFGGKAQRKETTCKTKA
jgi:hypothetical protein